MGFPTLKELTESFKNNDQVVFLAIQTVFEGYGFNSQSKLRKNQEKWKLKIPMAHAPGNSDAHDVPPIMRDYRSGGTPWTVIISRNGQVIYNQFHIEAEQATLLIQRLLAADG